MKTWRRTPDGCLIVPALIDRALRSYRKNAPETRAWVKGRMPAFALGLPRPPRRAPVFYFHDVKPERFRSQLQYLSDNGYRTLVVDDMLAGDGRGRDGVVLSFDDATWNFWAIVFPLLRRFRMRAVLFVIPGLVSDDDTTYPTIADVDGGGASIEAVVNRRHVQPLCTWRELAIMHESGLVDIQSHSLRHLRVPISTAIVDFVSPDFNPDRYGNVLLPMQNDDAQHPDRTLRFGAPVFDSASLFAGRRWRRPDQTFGADVVATANEPHFSFEDRTWRLQLTRRVRDLGAPNMPPAEAAEVEAAMRFELKASRDMLIERLGGISVTAFAYPWFEASPLADRIVAEEGYHAAFGGPDYPPTPTRLGLQRWPRISEEFLMCLPGRGRVPAHRVWTERFGGTSSQIWSEET